MSFQSIVFTVDRGIARIRFNRPDALNAWTRDMGFELAAALRQCADNDEIRAVVLTGEGRAFSAGADLKAKRTQTLDGRPDLGAALQQIYNPLILAIRTMPKPVIAAVNGPAVGFSCSLACACDLIVAAESAYFLLAFVHVGLVPDGGASLLIPARVGLGRATQLAMLGDPLYAADACAWGLVNEVCPDGLLEVTVDALASRLAAGPAGSYAAIKELFNRSFLAELEGQLGVEAAAQYRRGLSAEHAEGITAFLERRRPRFVAACDGLQ